MNSAQDASRMMWQHPFVNIFKQFKVESWKKSSKEGDVASVMDKQLKSTVFRILGSVPAGNYIQIPRTSTQSLGLTGRYLYILFKPIPTRYFVVHIDTATEEGLTIRISFSNLFKEFKCTSTWLQFPFVCHAAKGSVEHRAGQGAKADMVGAAPLAQKWTMLVLDMQYILSVYINRKFSHLKNLRICANLMVKNCFTSDIEYDPRLSFRRARELGIKSVEENLAPMPRDMNFHFPKNKAWDDLYDLVRFPTYPEAPSPMKPSLLPFDSIQRSDREPLVDRRQMSKRGYRGPPGVIRSPRREQGKTVHTGYHTSDYTTAQHTVSVATVPKKQPKSARLPIVSELPPVGLSILNSTDGSEPKDVTLVESSAGDVHIFTDRLEKRDMAVHRHYGHGRGQEAAQSIATVDPKMKRASVRSSSSRSKRGGSSTGTTPRSSRSAKSASPHGYRRKTDRNLDEMTTLEPDPILKLRRIIGFGSGMDVPGPNPRAYRHQALWHPDCRLAGGNEVLVYSVHAVIIAMEVANGHQHFFVGHTDSIVALAFNQSGSKSGSATSLLASAQKGDGGVVRVWRFDSKKCVAIVKSQQASCMNVLCYSESGAVLIGCGRDVHGKTLVIVWDTSGVAKHGSVSVIARARTDVEITRIRICPADDTRLVTCGRDNVRFWRVRSSQLRSCPVSLSEHKVGEITDITFATPGKVSDRNRSTDLTKDQLTKDSCPYSVYACTKGGYIIEVDFHDVHIKDMHRLLPTKEDMDASQKGIRLNVIRFSESYLATGSDDGFLRLWPLDLTTVFLEAKHEGPVTDLDSTPDDMKILAATSVGTLGYLDVTTRQYTTVMRSHTDKITDCCMDGLRRTITTCSEDGSIRVWDIGTLRQLYDFTTPDDTPVAITCHPTLELFACGFESGAVRVFHVRQTSLLSEHRIHSSKITGIVFAPCGEFLYSAEVNGTVTLYDTSDVEKTGSAIIRALPRAIARGDRYGPRSIAVAPDSRRVAFVGPTEYTVTVAAAATLDELLRIDISSGLNLEPDILKQKPSVDCPLRVCFSSASQQHVLVVTTGNRLLKLSVKDGCLLTITDNVHRTKATSITVNEDGNYFATAGDKTVKVWDYSLSKDINFQVFIGHCTPISRVLFMPDQLSLISCGEDGLFLWDFLGKVSCRPGTLDRLESDLDIRSHRESVKDENILSVGRRQRADLLSDARKADDTDDDVPTRDPGLNIVSPIPNDRTPQPRREIPKPTGPIDARKGGSPMKTQTSGWAPPDTLRTVDLDATDVSEFTVDAQMMENLVQKCSKTPQKQGGKYDVSIAPLVPEPKDDPIKVFWGAGTVRGKLAPSPIKKVKDPAPTMQTPTMEPAGFSERPPVLKHFSALENTSAQAAKRYAPRTGEEGLQLQAVIGYNGNGRGNLIWNPDTGIFAYSSGCIAILEDLANGTQRHLTGHSEEISTMALQHDSQILACASCERGMVHSEIGLWNVKTGECRALLRHHEHDVVALEYSRDDRFLVSVGDYRENLVVVWSAYDGETKPTVLASSKCKAPIHHVAWDPTTPNEFVTVGSDASIIFWLLEEYGQEAQLQFHEGQVPENLFKSTSDGRPVHFTSVCYGTDHVLYAGSNIGVVTAWDTQSNECFMHWKADSAEICVLLSKGARLLSGGVSRSLRSWSLTVVQESRLNGRNEDLELRGLLMEDEISLHSEITSAVFDETLDIGIVSTTAGTLWYVDWNDHSTVRMVTGHKGKINGIAFDDDDYFATCSEEGSVRLWSLKNLELTVQFQVLEQRCAAVSFSHSKMTEETERPTDCVPPAEKMLAAGYGDGTLRIFDVEKLILMLKLQPHSTEATSVAFAPDNCTLLSGGTDGRIAVTSLSTGVTLRVLDDHLGTPITQITVSMRNDHPASIMAHLSEKDSNGLLNPSVWLATAANRRVSVWVSIWSSDQCDMVDWLTFPAPCFAPDGTTFKRGDKSSLSLLPPSCCGFHPSNPDLLVYAGYGMEKIIQLYSLAKRKVVKSFSIPNWALTLGACRLLSEDGTETSSSVQLLALGTESRLVELVDACHGTFQDFCGHGGPVTHAKFAPNGRVLLTASGTELLLWKVTASSE